MSDSNSSNYNSQRFFSTSMLNKSNKEKNNPNDPIPFGWQLKKEMYNPEGNPGDASFTTGQSPTGGFQNPDSAVDVDVDM